MNTPTHILIAMAAFARPDKYRVNLAAFIGGWLPDGSLYLMAGWALFVQGVAPQTVFGSYYFSPEWMRVFALDNSFFVWGAVLALGIWWRRGWLIAFSGAGILHLVGDFLLHHNDARPNFWPLSNWIFRSPVSYWDSRYYGQYFAPLEIAMAFGLCFLLWRRFRGPWPRIAIGVAAAAFLVPLAMWGYVLAGGTAFAH